MLLFDYECSDCGHIERDRIVDKHDESVLCSICQTSKKMTKMFTGFNPKTTYRHHTSLKNYNPHKLYSYSFRMLFSRPIPL